MTVETSLFLARLMGPILLAMGLSIAFNPARMQRIGREFLDSEALIFLSGILTLPVGLAIVLSHNVWAPDWRVVITLFGWISIFAGAARLAFPGPMKSMGEAMLDKPALIALPGVVMAGLGGLLCYQGYLA